MNPADLCVDASYQRDISRRSLKLIEKLVAEWDWRRYNVPVVTRVGNAWHIIDGQHTAIAALTHGGIGEIDVLVVEAESGRGPGARLHRPQQGPGADHHKRSCFSPRPQPAKPMR